MIRDNLEDSVADAIVGCKETNKIIFVILDEHGQYWNYQADNYIKWAVRNDKLLFIALPETPDIPTWRVEDEIV